MGKKNMTLLLHQIDFREIDVSQLMSRAYAIQSAAMGAYQVWSIASLRHTWWQLM
jgi:hypothetical protein